MSEYTMSKASDMIEHMIEHPLPAGHNEVPYLEGDPGLGKSSMMRAIYQKYRRSEVRADGFTHLVVIVAPEREPIDFGLPVLVDDRKSINLVPLGSLLFKPDDRPFIFIDEIDKANNMLQNVLGRIMNDLEIGETKLPENTFIGAAGNKMTNRAGSFNANTHIKNRRIHIPVTVDAKEWIENVGIPFDLHAAVVSYIRTDPAMIHKFDAAAKSFPSPRSWTKTGLRINQNMLDHVERALIEGSIGVEAANQFWGHLKIFRALRSPETIIANPDKVPLPEGKNMVPVMYAEITSLAKYAGPSNADAIMRYFNRLPGEYGFVGYRDILMRDRKLIAASKAGQAWMVKNATLLQSTKS